ncbi:putative HTH-type transcriptional regulatorc/MT2039 [Thalassovita gelatinovora]|uniref:Putative HTH-type transcriptional regulatorc/MT2039 n=1 Tax=Thalassovita gelatinovora TaxID=53501 RepID=A0A0P1F7S9_THAGE|nr:LysR family transcriptional regulator ArgP [Thalassovita gelatinovora]QIZ80241.1 LysR family transcriptional regulator ArgP [Thalassovita gelatinovora]CUH64112.1 putative HTH-type transcriptional regulatorc/MT2039 [Thalassovita gelatinovora]SEQ83526.1 LysR family transcriptional regulator, chromosome initiation inhibitor [Thalassovita gelatinovora]
MLDYDQLETLAAVLRSGSFEAAAAQLHVTQSAVSQRIRQLEERIGSPLVLRGHPCTGTETGLRLARHAEEVALLESQVTDAIPRPAARMRIAINADSLATWVLPALAEHPSQYFDLVVDDQDHSAEWLKRGDVSAAVTSVAQAPKGCDSVSLGQFRYIATASPDFIARYLSTGVTAANLMQAPMLVFNSKDNLQHTWLKRYFKVIHRPKSHLIPSTQGFVDAAVLGMGWGLNPEVLVRDHLRSGALRPLLPEAEHDIPLYWQTSRLMARALAPVTASIRQAAKLALF